MKPLPDLECCLINMQLEEIQSDPTAERIIYLPFVKMSFDLEQMIATKDKAAKGMELKKLFYNDRMRRVKPVN